MRLDSYCIHNVGSTNWTSYAHLCDYAPKPDCYCIHCGCSAGCIIFKLSGVCIYQIQHNCRCVAGGSDSSQNVLCKTANLDVFGPCLMQVHFSCPICNCLTLLYAHPLAAQLKRASYAYGCISTPLLWLCRPPFLEKIVPEKLSVTIQTKPNIEAKIGQGLSILK